MSDFSTSELDRRRLLARSAAVLVGAAAAGPTAAYARTTAPAAARSAAAPISQIVVAQSGPIVALNPDGPGQNNLPSFTAYYACYDSLTDYLWPASLTATRRALAKGVTSLVVPQLATRWETARGGRIYRFHLRPGVMSQYGNEMSAEDVVWSMAKSLESKATGAFILGVIGGVPNPQAVKAIDERTVEFTLPAPNERILLAVGWGGGGAPVVYDSTEVKKHATAKDKWANDWLNKNTAGYGRYVLSSMTPGGASATFDARDDYWGAKPPVKRVVQRSVTDSGSRLQLLLTGAAHWASDLSSLQLDQVAKSPRAKIVHVDSSTAAFLPLTRTAPWNDPAIRRAIAQAIPYQDIVRGVFRGRAKPYQSILLPFQPEYTSRFAIRTNYEAAKRVLANVDTPLTLTYSEGLAIDEQIALFVQQGLKKAGFDLKLLKQPVGEFSTKRIQGGNEFFVDNLATPGIAAVDYYFVLYGGKGSVFNFHRYSSPEFDRQIKASTSPSGAVRAKAALEGQRIWMRDLPFIPVAWGGNNFAIAKQLSIPTAHTANGLVWWRDFKSV